MITPNGEGTGIWVGHRKYKEKIISGFFFLCWEHSIQRAQDITTKLIGCYELKKNTFFLLHSPDEFHLGFCIL